MSTLFPPKLDLTSCDSCHCLLISLLSISLAFHILNIKQEDDTAPLPPYKLSEDQVASFSERNKSENINHAFNISPSNTRYSCICQQTKIKVFNVGLPKSGTLSLHQLLESMGCNSVHWKIRNKTHINMTRLSQTKFTDKSHVGSLMQKAFDDHKPLLYYFSDDVNAITQMDYCGGKHAECIYPQIMYYQLLNEQYPDSLFILLRRNITKHIQSIDNWNNFRQRFIMHDIPFLPKGKGETNEEMRDFMNEVYDHLRAYFSDFSDRFLEYSLENDTEEALKQFLGCDGNYTLSHTHNTADRIIANRNDTQ